jgi:hypothetical protein
MNRALTPILAALLAMPLLAACTTENVSRDYPDTPEYATNRGGPSDAENPEGGIFGPGGIQLFGGRKNELDGGGGSGIPVNAYLWRASLDTVSFMPLASADPFGGVIITDWYSPADTPNERFKVTILILRRELRADGVRANVFRQIRDQGGGWIDSQTDPQTAIDMENAILTRARELRVVQGG